MKNNLKLIKKWLISLNFGRFIASYFEDFCIFSGLFFIVFATFKLSKIAGLYCLGICLLLLGIWFTRNPIRKG